MKLTRLLIYRPSHYYQQFIRGQFFTFFRRKHNICVKDDKEKYSMKLSTLYVPGRYGADMYQIVKPVINSDDISRNLVYIRKSCQLRGIDLDLENIVESLKQLETERTEFVSLVEKDSQYLEKQKQLQLAGNPSELDAFQQEHNEFIEKLKITKEKMHDTEELILPVIQKIPNIIHALTPLQSDVIEDYFPLNIPKNFKSVSHVDICEQNSLLKFSQKGDKSYYLKGLLSELELAINTYFSDKFRDNDFGAISCVDFCKSFILEAVGKDPYSVEQTIPIKMKVERGQKLNLVGGASFESLCAYLTNMNALTATLPMKYFSLGYLYNAEHRENIPLDLFSVVQSSAVHFLTLCENSKSEDKEFQVLFELISSCYKDLNIPFRVVNCSPKNLQMSESRRKQLEIWSPARQMYISVAHISGCGDFVSKRLHSTYGPEHFIDGYCHMVKGVAVNIPILIGCIVENFQKPNQTFCFPEELEFLQKLIND